MASEVINAVLSAEKAAADSYAESAQKCDLLKAEAHEKARSIQKEMKDESSRKGKRDQSPCRSRSCKIAGGSLKKCSSRGSPSQGRRSRQERRRGQNSFIPFHLTQAIIN